MTVNKVETFRGDHWFLSNFYPCPIFVEGILYPTAENAYQALKYTDSLTRAKIANMTPGQAKRYSQTHRVEDLTQQDCVVIMYRVLSLKFTGNVEMLTRLLNTNTLELIEGNDWGDTFWGVCNGEGHNYLGKMLMFIRRNVLVGTNLNYLETDYIKEWSCKFVVVNGCETQGTEANNE